MAVCEIDFERQEALHRRYELAAIPTTVIADHEGVVRRAFVGAFTATDLWAAVAKLHDPGTPPNPTSARCRRRSGAGRPPVHLSADGRAESTIRGGYST